VATSADALEGGELAIDLQQVSVFPGTYRAVRFHVLVRVAVLLSITFAFVGGLIALVVYCSILVWQHGLL